jgi:chromosome segregation ATPase
MELAPYGGAMVRLEQVRAEVLAGLERVDRRVALNDQRIARIEQRLAEIGQQIDTLREELLAQRALPGVAVK